MGQTDRHALLWLNTISCILYYYIFLKTLKYKQNTAYSDIKYHHWSKFSAPSSPQFSPPCPTPCSPSSPCLCAWQCAQWLHPGPASGPSFLLSAESSLRAGPSFIPSPEVRWFSVRRGKHPPSSLFSRNTCNKKKVRKSQNLKKIKKTLKKGNQ